ncbi:hypothetical protein [Nostoc commune]|uniref:hypothetical protein n=1 Tax=Nostoc commune TaxID=1178 RepID=UPI002B2181DA|nr:hypothetical protein [Nostoc commune]
MRPSTQDHTKSVLNAAVVLVMYGDYQCSQSADVYRLIKVIERQLGTWCFFEEKLFVQI